MFKVSPAVLGLFGCICFVALSGSQTSAQWIDQNKVFQKLIQKTTETTYMAIVSYQQWLSNFAQFGLTQKLAQEVGAQRYYLEKVIKLMQQTENQIRIMQGETDPPQTLAPLVTSWLGPLLDSIVKLSSLSTQILYNVAGNGEVFEKALYNVDRWLVQLEYAAHYQLQVLDMSIKETNTDATLRAIQVLAKTVQGLKGVAQQIVDILKSSKLTQGERADFQAILKRPQESLNYMANGIATLAKTTNPTVQVALDGLTKAIQDALKN